ncbi:MAG TPA: DUF192 domain-containing protein [Candidatus Limnocylindrales bacterium]|nr:DUF192 domain-containing protein [Candidatus Limnocylindrales bacterium]
MVLVAVTVTWVVPRLDVPVQFWASPLRVVTVDGRELRVIEVEYASGLRHVDSLGGLDGALFRFDQPLSTGKGMGMAGTLMDLDVVFFDPEGRAIDRHTMTVCVTQDCPGYYPSRPWQYAIEAPAGALEWVKPGAQLEL